MKWTKVKNRNNHTVQEQKITQGMKAHQTSKKGNRENANTKYRHKKIQRRRDSDGGTGSNSDPRQREE